MNFENQPGDAVRQTGFYGETLLETDYINANSLKRRLALLFADEVGVVKQAHCGLVWQRLDSDGNRLTAAELFIADGGGFANLKINGSDKYGYQVQPEDFRLEGDAIVRAETGDSLSFFATDQAFESEESVHLMINAGIEYQQQQLEARKQKVSRGLGRLFGR